MSYDLIIIGGGPAGYRAAERAGSLGMKTVLVEERALGGVCLNEGCIPTKTLLYSAKIYDYHKSGEKYGVAFGSAKLDHAAVVKRKDKVVKTLVAGVTAQMKHAKVDVVSASAKIVARDQHGFTVDAGGTQYQATKLLLCSGSSAIVPPIDGMDAAIKSGFAITSREALALATPPKSLIVIGGGVIGMEMASYFLSAGTQVTVVEMLPQIGGPIDSEIAALLKSDYEKRGMSFLNGAKVVKVGAGNVDVVLDGSVDRKTQTLKAATVLVSVGRRARIENLGLESLGVMIERGGVVTDLQMKTNVPNLFAAGDVNGVSMLAHTAYREAEVAVNVMAGRADRMSYAAIPGVIYTNPEVASVGETLASATQRGVKARELKLPMRFSGRYLAENEGGNGVAKIVVDASGRILGASAIGNPASEVITTMAVAIERQMRTSDLAKVVFPHPTVGEIFRELAFVE
ncbi:MAG: dihydrolipoyl dehydrogenase [Thermoguttaceae bacterium]